jgi:hypothetical protein
MKVAILGAGFSGMLAAYLLEKEGMEVTIYEKESHMGGHCETLVLKNGYTELGTVFSFTKQIKELLIELKVDYTERFNYRNFLDEDFNSVEHLSQQEVTILMNELSKLKDILEVYSPDLEDVKYGYIHEDLMITLEEFLAKHKLTMVCQVIAPHLSSYGFGNIHEIQAYYAFKVFNIDTIYSFILGDKLLFINKGTSELIKKLGQNISDIRYSLEVKNVEVVENNKVKVETMYGSDCFDKVLITTKLPRDVIKDDLYNQLMKKIDTNPFLACAYEVKNKNLVTTYYKSNLGKEYKLQFFYATRQNHRTTLVTYAYGFIGNELINGITKDLEKSSIDIKHLITAKQWYVFPHLNKENLTQSFYKDIHERQKISNICLIGSLVTKPEIGSLYESIKLTINELLEA